MERKLLATIIGCAIAGLVLSAYSFAHHESFVSGTFCTINATFNCDVVNRGVFSEIAGVPVALIGVLGYGFLLAGALWRWKRPDDASLAVFLALASAGGFAFALYLSSLEAFVLHAWCLVCLSSQTAIFVAFVASVLLWKRSRPAAQA